jgi:aspartyl-tRNA synthetase
LSDILGDWKRTHYCGELRKEDIGKEVCMMGWVHRRRDHGGLIFIDLRDRTGIGQLALDPDRDPEAHAKAEAVRNEFVVAAIGKVSPRPEGTVNPKMATGEVEVEISEIRILNPAKTPPFMLDEFTEVAENLRLKYRYLDLRREGIQQNLIMRHKVAQAVRNYLTEKDFLEIETPMLTKSTPEGARDYLVPSRVNLGNFYALPQSPQIFKQLLMVSGFDRYFQIVRCFRDEDLRSIMEGMIETVFKKAIDANITVPVPRMTYAEALDRYGVDNPDLRFDMELINITELVKGCGFKVFASVAESGGLVKAINAKGCATFSRRELDELTDFVAIYGAKGMAWVKILEDGTWQSPIAKFFTEQELADIGTALNAQPGDLLLFGADTPAITNEALGRLRGRTTTNLSGSQTFPYSSGTSKPVVMSQFITPSQPLWTKTSLSLRRSLAKCGPKLTTWS